MRMIVLISALTLSSVALASLPSIKPGVPGKRRGEIIAPMLDEQIAAWCDFNKQIVKTRTNVLCAYVGDPATAQQAQRTQPVQSNKMARFVPRDLKPTPYEMKEYGDSYET